ncbi:FtsW/RodA/SpoVE family cell cycle protein [Actinophytocola gossypii]|uniref:peptidoglycan glycosyltransferase n=1 Tax=Actinophytocola gossypii TaxID=2812003 RepID=A0ABT2JF96_9PSEU|nr:FtsW/RodA/SpoVE family cell cycle protein [Actinophytocola gossypii]MCT2586551.1 FtsW/RodA/SpoVE family cell cycle protein [Actinophytocola gossypii]
MASPGPAGPPAQGSEQPGGSAPTRRGTELAMLAFAAGLMTGALMLVEVNQEQQLTMRLVWYGLAYLVLFAVAHAAVRRWAPYADPLILPCVALLNGIGLVMIYRIDLALTERFGSDDWSAAAPKQVLWTTIATGLFIAVLKFLPDHRTLSRYAYMFGLAGLVLLALPGMLPAQLSEVNGAKIWLRLGAFSIQPGEFAKILLMVFFAAFLVSKRDLFTVAGRRVLGIDLPRARDMGPILFAWGICVAIMVFEKDLGTALLFFGVVLALLYVATERFIWVGVGLTLFAVGCVLAYQLFGHVERRVESWLDPFGLYETGGYQLAQALFAFATGGMFGTGLGAGRPDMLLYQANSDFITAVIGEELGFIGLTALLLVYMILALRGLRSAVAVRDSFGKLLGGGLSFTLIMQIFLVVGGVTTLIPLTGITAPFLSAGGSSLLANYVLVALLLRISDAARRPQTGVKPKPVAQAPIAEAHTVMVERPS